MRVRISTGLAERLHEDRVSIVPQKSTTESTNPVDRAALNGLDALAQVTLRRSRRRWSSLLLVGMVTVTSGVALFARNWWREHNGARIAAVVLSVEPDGSGSDTTALVRIRSTSSQPARTSMVHASSNRYEVGEDVTAIEDPFGSGHLTLPGSWQDDFSDGTNALLGISLFAVAPWILLWGSASFLRWRRMRRVLISEPWIDYQSRADETSSHGNTFIVTRAGHPPRPLRLTWTTPRSVRHSQLGHTSHLQIAGTESGQPVVVRVVDEPKLFVGQLGVPGDSSLDMSIREAGLPPRASHAAPGIEQSPILVYRPHGSEHRIFDAAGFQCGETERVAPRTRVVRTNDRSTWCTFTQPSAVSKKTLLIDTDGHVFRLRRRSHRTFNILDDTSCIGWIHVTKSSWKIYTGDETELAAEAIRNPNSEYIVDLRSLGAESDTPLRQVATVLPLFAQLVSPPANGG
jgi:hypothetical protein